VRSSTYGILFALGAAVASIDAQAPAPPNGFGIGVSLSPLTVVGDFDFGPVTFSQPTIVMPIRNGTMLFEPEIGIVRTSSSETTPGGTQKTEQNALRLGIGVLMETGEREQLRPYLGARTGLVKAEQSFTGGFGSSSVKVDGWYVGAVAGAQHYFTRHFSLGGEAQLIRTTSDISSSGSSFTPDASGSNLQTQGLMTIRWYF
jgi:hypothetical protein